MLAKVHLVVLDSNMFLCLYEYLYLIDALKNLSNEKRVERGRFLFFLPHLSFISPFFLPSATLVSALIRVSAAHSRVLTVFDPLAQQI